jgi:predicted nucleic acid-binding protein
VTVEVLRGMKHRAAHDRMARYFGCMCHVPTLNRIWERAASLAWQLDRKGRFMQVSDLIIASCALEADAAVLTLDSDFFNVPDLRVISRLE